MEWEAETVAVEWEAEMVVVEKVEGMAAVETTAMAVVTKAAVADAGGAQWEAEVGMMEAAAMGWAEVELEAVASVEVELEEAGSVVVVWAAVEWEVETVAVEKVEGTAVVE